MRRAAKLATAKRLSTSSAHSLVASCLTDSYFEDESSEEDGIDAGLLAQQPLQVVSCRPQSSCFSLTSHLLQILPLKVPIEHGISDTEDANSGLKKCEPEAAVCGSNVFFADAEDMYDSMRKVLAGTPDKVATEVVSTTASSLYPRVRSRKPSTAEPSTAEPALDDEASVFLKLEQARVKLEQELGEQVFLRAYRMIQAWQDTDSEVR